MATMINLNDWNSYVNGEINCDWLLPDDALDLVQDEPEKEWFIADIDSDLVPSSLITDYSVDVIEFLNFLSDLDSVMYLDRKCIVALVCDGYTYEEAFSSYQNFSWYESEEEYFDLCDELLDFPNPDSLECRYFNYDAYHRDCAFDLNESNGMYYI